jgi:hypothetical protein
MLTEVSGMPLISEAHAISVEPAASVSIVIGTSTATEKVTEAEDTLENKMNQPANDRKRSGMKVTFRVTHLAVRLLALTKAFTPVLPKGLSDADAP